MSNYRLSPSGIGYLDFVWNVTSGCTQCSPACDHCYAKPLRQTPLPVQGKQNRCAASANAPPVTCSTGWNGGRCRRW